VKEERTERAKKYSTNGIPLVADTDKMIFAFFEFSKEKMAEEPPPIYWTPELARETN
jgi:hypothetical protein